MPRRAFLRRRSRSEWAARGGLAVLALAAGYNSTVHSLARVIAHGDAALAHKLTPGNGQITAQAAKVHFATTQKQAKDTPRSDATAARLARLALRQDATAIAAIVVMGLEAQLHGDLAGARRWFAYSQALSRRDVQTQLWAIEDAAARGDSLEALAHYDIALRTSKTAPDLLYPVLANAISDPVIRSALAPMLARRPIWTQSFLRYLAESGNDPRSVALLFADARRAGVPIPAEASAKVVDTLVRAADYTQAWQYHTVFRPGASRDRSRDARFLVDPAYPSSFDWTPLGDGVIATSIQRGKTGGLFDFAAPPSAGGPLLQQMQLLPPGRYRLQGHSIGIAQPATSLPYWVLACGGGREINRVTVPPSAQSNGHFEGTFTVPADCPVQTLSFIARPSNDMAGVTGQIDFAQLVPVE
jgi:hypothetical protein